jgi:hypothetical protein
MCRFPGLLTVLGVCVAVVIAIAIGVAPATHETATSPKPIQVVRLDRLELNLFPLQFLPSVARENSFPSRGQAKPHGTMMVIAEASPRKPLMQLPKLAVLEVAMMDDDNNEPGLPFRR